MLTAEEPELLLACGHGPGEEPGGVAAGYCLWPDGKVCYDCDAKRQRELMQVSDRITAYHGGGRQIVTWPGRFLARIESQWETSRGERTYVVAVGPDGYSHWHGRCRGAGFVVTLRRRRKHWPDSRRAKLRCWREIAGLDDDAPAHVIADFVLDHPDKFPHLQDAAEELAAEVLGHRRSS
jgi:hypothetical protein